MCRALAYLGQPVLLDNLLYGPDNALVTQTYMPKMLHLLNLAGFGLKAWDRASHDPERPFTYRSTALSIYDRNLKALAEKIRPECLLAHVRGVPYNTEAVISEQNVHPFQFPGCRIALAHNGELDRIRDMKPLLAEHVRPEFAKMVSGTTDSEWIYAVLVSHFEDPGRDLTAEEIVRAVDKTIAVLRSARARLGIDLYSPANLFITTGKQLAAVRYCFDFGCYRTDDPARVNADAALRYYSLWYTSGREFGFHDGEWKMTGGADMAGSIMIASEPLTRDTTTWLEVPEYSMIYADTRGGRPSVEVHYLD
ncbi:MAG: class II glutamine amidotransferase [Betaproteobacteria bacterium]|nr:class II glutamine amidotransferase [Betaproteobacteria bacterium]